MTNPGGLVEEVLEKVHTTLQQQIEAGATGIRGYRNAVIADLFCGAGRMQKKGSGLPDVHRSVIKNGSKVFFGPNDDNSVFRAIVFRRTEEVDESTGTAAPATNITRYSSNLLEVVSSPEKIYECPLGYLARVPAEIQAASLCHGTNAISFASHLGFGLPGKPIDDFLRDDALRPLVSRLLNVSLYRFLEDRGLIIDQVRKRAYFPRTREGPREIRYQASFRQATRTVTRPLISRISQRVLYWVHEAIWFGFERYSGQLVLRILPGYVFTTDGNETLLDHRRVGALATRKAARDFSMQVFNHLVFWSWILSKGEDHILIPTGGDPIRVKSTFAGCDVQIPAGADVQFEPDDYQATADAMLDEIEREVQEDREVESEKADDVAKH